MTQAQAAIAHCHDKSFASVEDFVTHLENSGMDFIIRSWSSAGHGRADVVIFADGSSFFAESEEGYKPYPLDWQETEKEYALEFLPPYPEAVNEMAFDIRRCSLTEEESPSFFEHLKSVLSDHIDPPEAMRDLILDAEQEFCWADSTGKDRAITIITHAAQILDPQVRQITVFGDSRAGQSAVEEKSNAQTMAFILNMKSRQAGPVTDAEATRACYEGVAYAEISESGSDYGQTVAANDVLAWLSRRILERYGCPSGWSVSYNDGHYTRMSGYSASNASEIVEVEPLSNHAYLEVKETLQAILIEEDLYTGFLAEAQRRNITLR